MAEVDANQQSETIQDNEQRLKYLDFVQVAAIHVLLCFSSLYEFAKENSGPLKPGVQTVEDTVKTVIGPVYEKLHDVPFEILKFIDHKVEEYAGELEQLVPTIVKEASSQAFSAVQKAPEVAKAVASEVQRAGVIETATDIAKTVYTKCEPVGEQFAVSAWRSLNRLPLFPQVAEVVIIPTTAYWTEKYNQTVSYASEKGFALASYLPLVPIERIAKVFGNEEPETEATYSSSTQVFGNEEPETEARETEGADEEVAGNEEPETEATETEGAVQDVDYH